MWGIIFQTGCWTQGVFHMKDLPGVEVGGSRCCGWSACYQALAPPNLVVSLIKHKAIHAVLSFSLTQVFQSFLTTSCPRRPHHQFSNCSCFSISYFRSLLFPKEKWTKNNENWTGKISESRNSCNVQVGGVGVEGMMSSRKIETLVWDWRKG